MAGTTLTDDQFKDIFEKKGAAAAADLPSPTLPSLAPPHITRHTPSGPPPTLTDEQFDKILGGKSAPVSEGTSGLKQDLTPQEAGFQPKFGQDNQLLRAQNQGWLEQTGKTIGNTIANTLIDIPQALGYTGELLSDKHDYTNALIEGTEKWKNPFGEVYREHPEKTFDLADPAWWLSNASGFVEGAAQFIVPGEAEAAGMEGIVKALSTGMKLTKGAAEGIMGAGQVLSAAHIGYLMAASSGRQVYKDAYDTNYHRFLEQGYDPYTADDKAKEISSNAAAATVQIGTALNGIFGLASLSPLFRGNQNKIMQWLETKGARQEGESLEAWKGRLNTVASDPDFQDVLKSRPLLSMQGYPAQALQIGLQGIGGEYSDKVGREIGQGKSRKNVDYISDFFDKVTDQEGALNFLMGIVGGPAHAILADHVPVHSVARYDETGNPILKTGAEDQQITGKNGQPQYVTHRVSARTRDRLGNQAFYDNMRDAINKDVNWFSDQHNKLADAMRAGKTLEADRIRNELYMVNNLHAVSMGLGDNWKKEYQDITALDNRKDLGAAMQPQIDQLTQQIGEAKAQGQDTTQAEQQLAQLQDSQKKVAGKTDAMVKGFSSGMSDDEYKTKAARAVTDLDWMKRTYDNIRNKYVTITDPTTDQLAYHLFAREAELHMYDHILSDERASITRDEGILNPLQTFQQQIEVSRLAKQKLTKDISFMQKAMESNDLDGLRLLATKYGVVAYDDNMLRKGVDETLEKMRAEANRHSDDEETAYNTLRQNSGFDDWSAQNKGASFQDYLDHIQRMQPIDDRIAERKANLKEMESEREIKRQQLDRIKSSRGIEEFKKHATADMKEAAHAADEKNMKDNVDAFMKQQDMVAADRIRREQLQGQHEGIRQRMLQSIKRENEIKTAIQQLREQVAKGFEGAGKEERMLATQRKIRQFEADLARLQANRAADNTRSEQLGSTIQSIAQSEMEKESMSRDAVQNSAVPPVSTDTPAPENAPAPEPPPPAPQQPTSTADKPIEDYIQLKGQLPTSNPRLQNAVEHLEVLQDPDHYSFDLTRHALTPFVEDGTITEDMAHDIAIKQKDYLEHQMAEAFNASVPRADLIPTPLPDELSPTPPEPITEDDITGPEEPFSPPTGMSWLLSSPSSTPRWDDVIRQIDEHLGAKATDAMKVNTRSIEYMEVTKSRGGKTYHVFIPEYDKLDPDFNRNILKAGFIREGDELHLSIDENWRGKTLRTDALHLEDTGATARVPDQYEDYIDEDGKVRMGKHDQGKNFENAPIKITHARSGEVIGYLPRVEWVEDTHAEDNYRNIVDEVTDKDGNVTTGNVEAQKQRLMTVRRIISLAHNEGRDIPIKTVVGPRDSGGHIFYSTDVNRNMETSKLKPRLGKNLLPDPKLKFGLLNGGTVFIGHNAPLEGPKNFKPEDMARYGKPGQEANNIPMVILPMPNGKWSVSPLYTRSLADRPADIHTIARAIEAHMVAGTEHDSDQHKKWREAISKATSADGRGGSKVLDISQARDLESFINQYYTYTRHFRDTDTAFDAKIPPGGKKKPAFMLDIGAEVNGKNPIKIGTSWSGEAPIYASIDPHTGKLNERFEEALTNGLATHYKNVVYTRGDLRGLNDERPFHSLTITRDGRAVTNKFDNYNEYLKSFADTIVYGHHQAEDGTYLYGANPVVNFDFAQIAATRLTPATEEAEPAKVEPGSEEEDDIFNRMMHASPLFVGEKPDFNTLARPAEPGGTVLKLQHVIGENQKTRTLEGITENVYNIYDQASANPDKQFTLDFPDDPKQKIKLGDKSSITMTKLATIIDSRPIPYNVHLSEGFMSILENTPRRFLNHLIFEDRSMYKPLPYDAEKLGQQIEQMFVPVRDANGNKTGVFDAERQVDITNTIVHAIKDQIELGKLGKAPVSTYRDTIKNNVFKMMRNRYDKIAGGTTVRGMEKTTPEQAAILRDEYDKILRSFDTEGTNFWSLAIDRLKAFGVNVVDRPGAKSPMTDMPERTADGENPSHEAEFNESAGHGLRDWSDVAFETNPKDTMTARMKLQVATTPDSVVGDEQKPREVDLSFSDPKIRQRITSGQKLFTTRTPEQVAALGLKKGVDVTALIDGKLMRVTPLKVMDESDAVVHGGIGEEEGTKPKPGDMLLQLQPYEPKKNVVTTNKNYLGLPKFADYENLFESVLGKLADQPRDFQTYLSILRNAGNEFNPNLRALADRLEQAPTEIQNEFTSVVSLQYQPFTMVLLDTRRDSNGNPYQVLRAIEANRGSQINTIVDGWQQNQKYAPVLRKNAAGITVVNAEHANGLKKELGDVNKAFAGGDPDAYKKADVLFRRLLDNNGITMPDEAIKSFITNTLRWTRKTSVAGDFRRQFAISDKGEPLGIVSSLILKLAGVESANDNLDEMEDKSFMLSNPLYTEKNSVQVLARVAAEFTPNLYSSTHLSSEGKNIYDYGFNSTLSRNIQQIKGNVTFRGKFQDVDIAKKSWLLEHLNNNPELRDRFSLAYLDGFKVAYMPNASGVTRPDMSDREQLLTSIGLFINQADPKYAHYLSLTHSDKSTTPIFRNAPRLREVTTHTIVQDRITGQPRAAMRLSEEAINRLHDVFNSEYDRIKRAEQVGDYNNPKYEEGAKHFYFLPQMNYEDMKKAVADGKLDKKVFEKIWVAGQPRLNVKETAGFKEAVQHILTRHVDDMTNNTLDQWKKNDIISDKVVPFDRKYLNRLMAGVGITYQKYGDEDMYVPVGKGGDWVDKPTELGLQAQLAARDYVVNHYLMNVSMSQLFYGDPAQVWKGSVEKTMTEYGKRLAKDIAPGRELAFKPGETYRSITARDWKTNAPYLKEVEGLKKAYADGRPLESTDAQEFTTVKEHLDVLRAAGRITDRTYGEMTAIIDKAKGGYYEFTDPHHLDVVMQPQKPVYVGDRTPSNGAILNDYIKSSSYPLYPPFLAGKELDKARTAMEKGGIARLNFESAHKIGVPTSPARLFDDDGRFIEGSLDNPAARQDLSRDGFRIQQEVPYDEDKDHIRTVSQMNKLITQGLPLIHTPFSFDGRQVSAEQIMQTKEDLRKQMFTLNRSALLPEIGGEMREGSLYITDQNKLFDTLRKRALEGNLGLTANDLAYLEKSNRLEGTSELVIPLMYAPNAPRFESMLMSLVGDLGKVDMPGKSYIQASPAGQRAIRDWESLPEKQRSNIVWTSGYDGGDLKTVRLGEKKGDPLQPAQVIAPWRFKGEMKDFLIDGPDGRKMIDPQRIPRELLQMVGARIPNQGHNSMLPIEVVGFVPENMGDLVIVPAAITKQMGSDFDVDKLYAYMRAYQPKVQVLAGSGTKPLHDNIFKEDDLGTLKYGNWEGKEMTAENKAKVNNQIIAGNVKIGDTGETFHEFEDRTLPKVRHILDTAAPNSVIATHSSVLRLIEEAEKEGWPADNRINPENYIKEGSTTGEVLTLQGKNGPIHIVRHGETEDNADNTFRTHDAQLTDKGIRQARVAGQKIKDLTGGDVPVVYTSPLERAVHTSNLMMDEIKGNTNVKGPIYEPSTTEEDTLKNKYFDLHWSVLTHPEMLQNILNPLDKDDLKQEAALISKWEEKQSIFKPTYYDPSYQLKDFQSQKDAKRLVGLSSLSVTFNPIIQDKNIRPGHITLDEEGQRREIIDPVHIIDENGKRRVLSTLSGYGRSVYNGQARSKHDNHTTIQSEVVDYAKNKISDKVHLSTYTYPASAGLTQLQEPDAIPKKGEKLAEEDRGWAAHLGFNARLLSQPIIQEYVAELSRRGDSLSGDYTPDLKKVVAESMIEKYGGMYSPEEGYTPSYADMTDMLEKPNSVKDFNTKQAEMMSLFMKLDNLGTQMLRAQSTINHDTNGAGSTLLDTLSQERTKANLEPMGEDRIGLLGTDSLYISKDDKPTEQGELYDMIHDAAREVVGNQFPYEKMMPMFNYLMEHTNRQDLSIDTQKNVFNSIKSFLFSHPDLGFWANPETTRADLLYRRQDHLSLADRVHEAKQTWGQKNYFLQRLQADIDPDGTRPNYLSYQASKASRLDDYENTKAWLDLFLSPNEEKRRLAEDLVRYAYLTGGNQDARSFVKYVPYSYLIGTDFGTKLRELTRNITKIADDNFREQWFQHNPQFAKSFSPDMKELGSAVEKYPETLSLQPINQESPDVNNPAKDLIVKVKQEKGVPVATYPDYLSYRSRDENRWILYKKMGREDYMRIDTLGDKNMDEYSVGEGGPKRSLIPENRARYYDSMEETFRTLANPVLEAGRRAITDMNIPEKGGEQEMKDLLGRLADNPKVPEQLRLVSSFLQGLHLEGALQDAGERVFGSKDMPIPAFSFRLDNSTGHAGAYNPSERELLISTANQAGSAGLAETVNHEMIHAHTAIVTMISENENWMRQRGYASYQMHWMKNVWGDISDKHPEVAKAIERLEEVRKQAEQAVRDFAAEKGVNYNMRAKQVIGTSKVAGELDRLIYHVSSNTEFVTGVLTNPAIMRFLNQHPFEGQTEPFMSKVIGVLKDMMMAIGRAFGMKAERGSLLEASLQRSLELMTVGKHSFDLTPERMSDPNNMQFLGTLAAPVTSSGLAGLDRIMGKLEEQREELANSLTGRLSKEDIADKRAKIDDIETDLGKLRDSLDMNLLTEIGDKHLDWIQKVLDAKEPTNSQIMTGSRVLEVWTNLVDLLYGENGTGVKSPEIDKAISDIYSRAQVLRANLTLLMKNTLINTSDNVIGIKDFNSFNLHDIDRMQGLVRGLSSAATSRVTQYVASYMETVARHRDEDVVRLVDKMRGLEDDMARIAGGKHNLKGFYKQFFQENSTHDAWGLVQRFHQDWYDFRKSARASRTRAVEEINARGGSAKEKQAVWQSYWKKMNESAVFADTRMLFDQDTGALKDDNIANAHRQVLENEIGKDAADELINDAQERYKQYLDHKEAHFTDLDGEVAAGQRPQQEADRLKDEFVARYSPNVFFNNFKSKLAEFRTLNSDDYVRMAPRRYIRKTGEKPTPTTFYDEKFEEIQKKPEVKAVYDRINDTLQELKNSLPVHVQMQMGKNFMPVVAKSLFTDMLDVPGYIKTMGRRMIDDLTASAQEELEGDKSWSKLPIRYVADDRKNLPLESRSTDIPRMLEAFGMMALHYKHFADAKDYIDMGETILREIDRARSEGATQMEQNGKLVTAKAGLRNTLDALRYMKDYLMYKKTRSLEGKTETMLYSANPAKNFKITHSVKELIKERTEIEQKRIDGDIDPSEAEERTQAINEQLKKYEGRRLYGSKIGDKLIGINQLKTLSYNPFSGIANVGFGMISAAIHANGRTDFGWKDLGQAYKLTGSSILRWATAGKKETANARKILSLMDRMGIIGDVIDSHYGKIRTRERVPGWKKVVDPYNLMRSGDYYMKALTTVAMMLHDKVKVTEGGVEKEVSLWEAHNEDGEWDTKRFGENPSWHSENVDEQKDFDKFRNKAIRVNMIIHGNQDKNSPKLANKYILGRLIGQFRMSWLPEGWYSRFQGERYDVQLGREIKGRYATIKDLGLMGYATVTLKQLASIVSKVDPYTGVSRLDGKPMSAVDIDNMRRNFAELGAIAGMAAVIVSLKSAIDPDEDSTLRYSLRLLTNQLIRNRQDLTYYSTPGVFDNLTRNIIPASQVLTDYWKALKATARVMSDSDYEANKWILAITHAGLPIPQATLVNKFNTAMTKDLDTIQQ